MKRLILLATMVAVLASCEKHEIQNEVINEIGFTSKIGKQTKAIAENESYTGDAISNYFQSQPFGVYAYGHQGNAAPSNVMNNVEITYQTTNSNSAWKASGNTKYYWPNDSRTTLNFYAYSPYQGTGSAEKNHQKLTGTISHSENGKFILTDYIHSNQYVDFMVADDVTNQTFSSNNGTVNMQFRHKLTQLNFNVSCNEYPNIDFTIKEIKLVHLVKKATYTQNNNTPWAYKTTQQTSDDTASFVIFPAKLYINQATNADGAPVLVNTDSKTVSISGNQETITDGADNTEDYFVVENNNEQDKTTLSTTPVTVIPQNLIAAPTPNNDGSITDNGAQYIRIKYVISGTGVATEEVIRYVYFNGVTNNAATNAAEITWEPNKKITYNLVIGLNEIKFNPTIIDWSPETSADQTIIQ